MLEPDLNVAISAWQSGNGIEAEQRARAVVACDPGHLDAHRLLQEILAGTHRVAEAIAVARCVIRLAPRDAAARRRLADLLSRDGDAEGAVAALRQSLEIEPDNVRALNNLGNLLTGLGRTEEAIRVLARAVDRRPDYPAALTNLGVAYARMGHVDRAIDCYQRALRVNRRSPEALLNLASAYLRAAQPEAALAHYDEACALARPDPAVLTGRGEALLALRRCEEALACFDEALRLSPGRQAAGIGRAHAFLGLKRPAEALSACEQLLATQSPPPGARGLRATALLALDRLPEAIAAAGEATSLDPSDTQAFVSLGFALLRQEKPELALASFETAARLEPKNAKAHSGRASALQLLGRATEAIDAYNEAIRLDPADTNVYLNSGYMMMRLGDGASALTAFEAALTAEPGNVAALEGRAMALLALGRHEEALRAFVDVEASAPALDYLPGYRFNMQLWCCDWSGYESTRRDIAARVARGERADVPLSFLAHSTDPADQLSCARAYVADKWRLESPGLVRAARPARSKLRIGYLSFDFRNHPVGQLSAALLESHDRSRFEVHGLCACLDDGSDLRQRLAAACDYFEDISALTDRAAAERIAALDIDILIDLGGHTLGSRTRVLAFRPAPVQVSFLGFAGTVGADYVDYLIADRHVIPEAERPCYAEQLICLPETCLPSDFPGSFPPSPPRRAAGLPDDVCVFCCFNSPFKITPAVFDRWMRVLRAVPGSVLWLRDGSDAMKRNLARESAARGVDSARLIYAPRVPSREDHLSRLALADLFLDTTPYNAHTTASDALAAGVPVITLRGRTFASRVATSLLHAIGLGHLSVGDPDSYERLAIELARSPPAVAALKSQLDRARHSAPLFDPVRFCRHLEAAFVEVAARCAGGEPPGLVNIGG